MAQLYPNTTPGMGLNTLPRTEDINTPPQQDFDTPSMQGSLQQFLSQNLGQFVVVEFLIGTQTITQKSGILYAVGTSVMTLYEELSQTFVVCDIFSVKFVTFYLPGRRPQRVPGPYAAGPGFSAPAAPPMGYPAPGGAMPAYPGLMGAQSAPRADGQG